MLAKFLLGAAKLGQLQFVGAATGTFTSSTSTGGTLSLTSLTGGIGSSAQAGDLVIAGYCVGGAGDVGLTITDGTNNYTLIGSELYANGSVYDTNLRVAYKRLTGADASVTFGPSGATTYAVTVAASVWRGVHATTPLDVSATTATGTNTSRPNPAAITPITAGAKIVVFGGGAAATTSAWSAAYLSGLVQTQRANISDSAIATGYVDWTSGAYDPAQFGLGSNNAADSWAAVTIALRPA